MSHRFYVPSLPAGDVISLTGDQAHHATNVMRFQVNDQLILFDGSGTECHCRIEQIGKKDLQLRILERRQCQRQIESELVFAVALPKGDRQKFLIEKLVELGVNHLLPLATSRSVAVANDKVLERLRKQVVEASKQCERNTLLQIHPPVGIADLAVWADQNLSATPFLCYGDPYQGTPIADLLRLPVRHWLVTIGPEGGLTEAEQAQLDSQRGRPITMGPAILRVETAALAAASILGIGREVSRQVEAQNGEG